MGTRLLTIICLGVSLGNFVFECRPFGVKPINTARLLDDGKGLHPTPQMNVNKMRYST